MYTRRRKKYRNMIRAGILVAVALLFLTMLLGYLGSMGASSYEDTPANEITSSTEEKREIEPDIEAHESEEEREIKEEKETYYYVKYDNDVICVYFSDEQGNLTKLEETGILYEMLSTEDQIQFKEGVRLKNRDALNKLLMDYES